MMKSIMYKQEDIKIKKIKMKMMKIRLRQNEDNYDKTDNENYTIQVREGGT